jgi:Icc-related predicted phosphoesterase
MKIVAIADQHGYFPKIEPCELLIIAGDICPWDDHSIFHQAHWLDTHFRWWLKEVEAEKIIGIWGNHDFIGEKPLLIPDLPWTLLEDSQIFYKDYKIWGSPHTLYYGGWAFNLYENDLEQKWSRIPEDTDILVCHSPPFGYGDLAIRDDKLEHVGSPSLMGRIKTVMPKLVVYGHIHRARGQWDLGSVLLANVSVDGNRHSPMVFHI